MRDASHAAGLVVEHGLADLVFGVHHERAVAHHRLVERQSADQQHFDRLRGVGGRGNRHRLAVAGEGHHMLRVDRLGVVAVQRLARETVGEHVPGVRHRLLDARAGREREVQIEDRRARFDRGLRAERFTRDHLDRGLAVRRAPLRNARVRHFLIARRDHLVARRQVHPQLQAVHAAARARELGVGHLAVDHARTGRHPLDVARIQRARLPRRILVAEAAREHVRDRLEAAMRMVGRALGGAGRVVGGPHFVEQQKRVEIHQLTGGERAVDDESPALGGANRGKDAFDRADGRHGYHLGKMGIARYAKQTAIIGSRFGLFDRLIAMDCPIAGTTT
ncbi:conserved hypothetical protein [Paraburkholderia tropica]